MFRGMGKGESFWGVDPPIGYCVESSETVQFGGFKAPTTYLSHQAHSHLREQIRTVGHNASGGERLDDMAAKTAM